MVRLVHHNYLRLGVVAVTLLPTSVFASAQCEGATAAGGSCTATDFNTFITHIINTIFNIVGILSVIVLLVGATRYITSTGDSKRIQAAKDTILYAIIGIVVAIMARAIVAFTIARVG